MDDLTIQAYVYAAVKALYDAGVPTWHLPGLNAPVSVVEGPSVITLALELYEPNSQAIKRATGVNRAVEGIASQILNLPLGQSLPVRLVYEGAYLKAEFPRLDPWRPTFAELEDEAADSFLVGLDQIGQLVTINLLTETYAGMLVAGATGSGKTTALRLLTVQALARGWTVALCDLKGDVEDWSDLEDFSPYPLATSERELVALMEQLAAILQERYQNPSIPRDPVLLVVDEVIGAGSQAQARLSDLARTGRAANLRILLGAHRVGKELDTVIRSNVKARLVGQVTDSTDSRLATGLDGQGAEFLQGAGDMLLVIGQSARRVQVARAEPGDVAHVLVALDRQAPAAVKLIGDDEDPGPPAVIATLDDAMACLSAEARTSGGEPPPVWLVARGIAHAQRTGKVPSFGLIRSWHEQEMGTSITDRRARGVRWAAEVLGVSRHHGITAALEGAPNGDLGGFSSRRDGRDGA